MILAVAASPSVDLTYVVDTLTLGQVHRPQQSIRLAGGKGVNVARVICALGGASVATGIVGGGSGLWFVDELRREGVAFIPVTGTGETRTCVSIADLDAGRSTEVYEPASPVLVAEWNRLERTVERQAAALRPTWITLCGSIPSGAPDGAVAQLIDIAHRAGARLAVDTQGAPLLEALNAGADLVKVNVHETADALGDTSATPEELCHSLQQRAAATEHIIVTAGADGAYALSAGRNLEHVRPEVSGRYTAGCGDAFLAGLVQALATGHEIADALRTASTVAAANAQIAGAGRLDLAMVR